ncbi:MAG TPA: M20 family metallopeptidase [Tissierellia bacterium]|jgi:acetylornithine deacetylase/succinyl-diaminopimelate desuccinylase|nr:M20 family metallopeptidase [Tissierellia bacterium]
MKDFSDGFTREEVVALTQELIRIPSHRDVKGRETDVANFIYNYCSNLGFECEKVPVQSASNNPEYCRRLGIEPADPPVADRFNVNVRLCGEGDGPTLLFNGHMDTVPPFEMVVDPYGAEIRNGNIYGRGANDMKGALACMITAMAALKRTNTRLKGDVLFTAVIGEEDEGEGTEEFVRLGGKADGAIVGEPSGYEYAIGHRGLEWIEVTFTGKTVHGGQAHLGINAITKATKFITRVEETLIPKIHARTNEYMGTSIMNYGTIHGGDQPSTVAGTCRLQLDRRYLPGETVETVLSEYQAIIDELSKEDPDFKAELSLVPNGQMRYYYHMPLIPQPEKKLVNVVRDTFIDFLGEEATLNTTRGWTDAAILSSYGKIPSVVMGPGNVKNSHTKDEHIEIDQLVNYVQLYANIAERFCTTV